MPRLTPSYALNSIPAMLTAVQSAVVSVLVFLLFCVVILHSPLLRAEAPLYGNNPQVSEHQIYLSSQGIRAFDRKTGQLLWQALTDLETFKPLIYQQWLLVGSDEGLQALARDTGELVWQQGQGEIYSPVVLDSNAFLTSRRGNVQALALNDQKVNWQITLSGRLLPPVLHQGVLVVMNTSGRVWGVEPTNGDRLWSLDLDTSLVSEPVASKEGVFALSKRGRVISLNAQNGSIMWQRKLEESSRHQPVLAKGNLYITRKDGLLEIISQRSGHTLWLTRIHAEETYPPLLHQGVVSIYDNSGRVTYFDLITLRFKQVDIPGISMIAPWADAEKVFWQPSESGLQFKVLP